MGNMNNQGKTPKQIKDSKNFILLSMLGIFLLLIVSTLL
jgi:competence protein ComGC